VVRVNRLKSIFFAVFSVTIETSSANIDVEMDSNSHLLESSVVDNYIMEEESLHTDAFDDQAFLLTKPRLKLRRLKEVLHSRVTMVNLALLCISGFMFTVSLYDLDQARRLSERNCIKTTSEPCKFRAYCYD
jgi:hypothetical protein